MTSLSSIASNRPLGGVHRRDHSTLKIATYNVLFKTNPAQTKADLSRLMEHNGVLNLQEFTPNHQAVIPWAHSKGWGAFHPKGTEAAVMWDREKYAMEKAGSVKLNEGTDLAGRHYPAHRATWVRLRDRATGEVFTTVSVHTIAHNRGPKITPKVDAIARHQFRVLGELAQKASGHGPVLIGGDLNTQPGRQLTWPGKILKNAKLESNWQQLGTKGVGPGTHGHSFIDQFLTLKPMRKDLKLMSHDIVRGLHSDHNALRAKYRLG
jgi:endonuclease/exonuclease/phosphatase (EEP) superfamily protein YafD